MSTPTAPAVPSAHATAAERKPAAQPPGEALPVSMSVLSATMNLTGVDVDSSEDLTVHGSINGTVRVRDLIVAKGAVVTGTITAEFAKVYGTLNGDVTVKSLIVADGATLGGSLKGGKIGIQPGAKIKASIDFDQAGQIPSEQQPGQAQQGPADAAMGEFGNIVRLDRATA